MHQDLTFEQSIGQHLMISLDGTELDEQFIHIIRTFKVGNVLLRRANLQNPEQIRSLCDDIRTLILEETTVEPCIAVVEDGGTFSTFPADVFHIPSAMAIGATAEQGNAYTAGRMLGDQLQHLGLQSAFAPNLSVSADRHEQITGTRTFADDPETVCAFASSMIRGLVDAQVMSIGTGFPPVASCEVDETSGLHIIRTSKEQMLDAELAPLLRAIEAHIPAIQIAHVLIPALESHMIPASLSRSVITDFLRHELDYKGLIFTDCVQEHPIAGRYGTAQSALQALHAGADMIVHSHSYDDLHETMQTLADGYHHDHLKWEDHEQSVIRIRAAKHRFQRKDIDAVKDLVEHRSIVSAMMDRAICAGNLPQPQVPELGECPLILGPQMDRVPEIEHFASWLAKHVGGQGIITSVDPANEEIIGLMEPTRGATSIICFTFDGCDHRGQLALANAMAGTGLPTIVIAMGTPHDLLYLADNSYSFATFEYSELAFESIRRVVSGQRSATGILPVHW